MKIIITGATSALAQAVVEEHLKCGVEVHAIVRPNSKRLAVFKEKYPTVKVYEIDITEYSSKATVEKLKPASGSFAFFHFAWDGVSSDSHSDILRQSQNIVYTFEAVELFSKLMGKFNNTKKSRFIFAGSWAEFECEKSFVRPASAYAVSKRVAATFARKICEEKEISFIHTRIFGTYGVGNITNGLFKYIIPSFIRNDTVNLTKCTQKYSFLNYRDVGKIYCRLGKPEISVDTHLIYEVKSNDFRILKDYILEVHELIGSKSKINFGAFEQDEKTLPFEGEMNFFNFEKELGFTPEVDFSDGIQEVINVFKKELAILQQ